MSDMTKRLLAMQAQLDAVLQPETCGEAMERIELDTPRVQITIDERMDSDDIGEWIGAFFAHPERIEITRFEVHALKDHGWGYWEQEFLDHWEEIKKAMTVIDPALQQATLPGALIEREKICNLCDCPTTEPRDCEIKGSRYTLCGDCYEDNLYQITDALAKADADGAAEDAAQEEL